LDTAAGWAISAIVYSEILVLAMTTTAELTIAFLVFEIQHETNPATSATSRRPPLICLVKSD
jgi:hypothetical protein